jgi:23S rRNA (uracil1939-C5)-methyltransferase
MTKIKIDKLVFGGQGMGRLEDGRVCFVWNVLPGEEVEVEFTKNKGNFAEGIAKNILQPSAERVAPREEHYLSCSPWQIMSFAKENEWKVQIAEETYGKIANLKIEEFKDLKIVTDNVEYGYRNKMEYSFAIDDDGQVSLGFHIRESRRYIPIHVCELARKEINAAALNLLAWVRENKIPIRS